MPFAVKFSRHTLSRSTHNLLKSGESMNRPTKPFQKPMLHGFLFFLFLALLSWPLLTIADQTDPPHAISVYLFVLWSAMITLLFVIGRICHKDLERNAEKKRELGEH
jgi:hypothetical protein